MSRVADAMPRSPFSGENNYHGMQRHIPILPSSTTSTNFSQSDIMDATPPASSTVAMGPPSNSSPEMEHDGPNNVGHQGDAAPATNGVASNTLSAAAAASSQQPKVVQTAFIHKLYKYALCIVLGCFAANVGHSMLEDRSIQNLISWSNTNESFVMSPSQEFSKVLA